jgi:hypothetical protein
MIVAFASGLGRTTQMNQTKRHNVDIGDDRLYILAQCSCGWSQKNDKRHLRLASAYRHLAEILEANNG